MFSNEIKIPFGGRHFPEIQRYMSRGYKIVKEVTFPAQRVVMRLESKKGDTFCIDNFDDAVYFMSGGFPKPHMVICQTISCPCSGKPEIDGEAMWARVKLGWAVKSYDRKNGYILTGEENVEIVAKTLKQIKELTGYGG